MTSEGAAVEYFTNFGPKVALKDRDVPGAMGVLRARDDDSPIGQTFSFGRDGDGDAVFQPRIGRHLIEGRWLLVGREFVPAS
jgi:hypothetical protein